MCCIFVVCFLDGSEVYFAFFDVFDDFVEIVYVRGVVSVYCGNFESVFAVCGFDSTVL